MDRGKETAGKRGAINVIAQILSYLSPMVLAWLVALLIFAVAEGITVSLVSVWFIVGALVAMIAAALGAPVWLQVMLFLVVSIALLALLRPFVRRISKPRPEATNADRHIGRTALVTEEIDNLRQTGAVRLDGVVWTARSESDQVIPVGATITVKRIAGAKAYVDPAEETVAV